MPKKRAVQLNEDQKKVISHKKGTLLVVAGAGTGKTRVITERIKNLIEKRGVDPKNILALTFTDKAAGEMIDRIGDVMPLGYEEPWVSTFHSFSDRILRAEGIEIGLDPGYKLITPPEQWILLRKNFFKIQLDYFRPLGNPTKFISAILKFISRLQDENISNEEFEKFAKKVDLEKEEKNRILELSHLYNEYTRLKLENSKMDFGDLINWNIRLFKERPNILKKYTEQFEHVLVDEFQDTNYAQYELIKLLCPKNMGNRSLVVVGDDSQSIYKFRGAAVSNILQFMKDYPDSKQVTLTKNYRSYQENLDPAYSLIKHNDPDTLESKLGISKKLESILKGKGAKPLIIQTETLEDEIKFVLHTIKEILGKEPEMSFKDIAVLARANSHLDPFVLAVRKEGIPYQLVGNRGLYDRNEIRDIVALLKTCVNPKDGVSVYRTLNITSLEINSENIFKLLAESKFKKSDLWEEIKKSEDEKIISFEKTITKRRERIPRETPSEFIFNLVSQVKYIEPLVKNENIENQLAIKNLNIFLNKAKDFEIRHREDTGNIPTILEFLDYLEMAVEAGENPAQAEIEDIDTVNFMTVHASKGLEFPVVIMINLVSDRFPSRNMGDLIDVPDELIKETLPSGDPHIQEERRLFYVGMTRAQKYLFLTLAKDYGGKREKTPSGFLTETGLQITPIEKGVKHNTQKQDTLFGVKTGFRDMTLEKIQSSIPDTMSYTQIDTYNACPLRYKFNYVLKIPTLPNYSLSFGTTMHETLKEYYMRKTVGDEVSLKELLEIYEKKWVPVGYDDEEHRNERFESGKKILENYYNSYDKEKIDIAGIEKSFNLRIAGVKFFGRIDRIDNIGNGNVEIVDYKTGKVKSQADVDRDAQVTIYAMAAKNALGMNPKILSLYFLESGEKVSTTRTEKDFEKQTESIISTVEEIKANKFEPNPGIQCERCDYRDICPSAYKQIL